MRQKRFVILCLLLLLSFLPSFLLQAKDKIKKTQSYETTNASYKKGFQGEFSETIEENGNIYFLDNITYRKIGKKKKTNGSPKTVSTTKTKSGLASKRDDFPNQITYQGISCKKTGVSFSQTGSGRTEKVTKKITGTSDNFPKTKSFSIQSRPVVLERKKVVKGKAKWKPSSSYTIVVKNYEKGSFLLGGKRISFNSARTGLEQETTLVKKQLGLSSDSVKITKIGWSGKPYKKENLSYRNIVVNTSKKQVTYTATYSGSVTFANTQYTATATYQGTKKNTVTVYQCQAIATYKKQEDLPEPTASPTPAVAVSGNSTTKPSPNPSVTEVSSPKVLSLPVTDETIVSTEDFQASEGAENNTGTTLEELTEQETKKSAKANQKNPVLEYTPMILILGGLGFAGYMIYRKIASR